MNSKTKSLLNNSRHAAKQGVKKRKTSSEYHGSKRRSIHKKVTIIPASSTNHEMRTVEFDCIAPVKEKE